jgi:NAD(P)-dependent dehydrogenase (short-subunit alcohol dehydrogenase family)
VAVVTGGARGIGRAIGARLVTSGYQVVLTDVDPAVRRTAEEIGAAAGLEHDVRDEAAHGQVAREAARFGPVRVWVNNAGVGDDGGLEELSAEAVRRLVEVNLLGTAWGMRAALRAFEAAAGDARATMCGDVLNIASLSGFGPVPGLSVYGATKAAVLSLTASVQAETPPGVRLHALCPDGVDTDLVSAMDPAGLATALNHSGGGLLDPERVAAEAVALLGARRVVRSVPGWRGAVARTSGLAPSVFVHALPVVVRLGRLGQRRVASSRH